MAPSRSTLPCPSISGTTRVSQTLTAITGSWGGDDPKTYTYGWFRCDAKGQHCVYVTKGSTYKLTSNDVGHTMRVAVTATNNAGTTTANSKPSAVVTGTSTGACAGSGTVNVTDIALPIRLLIDKWSFTPAVVTRGTRTIVARVHIADTCGHSVAGARVWATAIPYNQVSVAQTSSGGDGYATLTFQVKAGFPANPGRQQIMAVLVRASDPKEKPLAGKSTRRVLSLKVHL